MPKIVHIDRENKIITLGSLHDDPIFPMPRVMMDDVHNFVLGMAVDISDVYPDMLDGIVVGDTVVKAW